MQLFIHIQPLEIMHAHARAAYPYECCGFLFGNDGDSRKIVAVVHAGNAAEADRRRKFRIAPRDYLHAEQYALDNRIALLGIYHSHPDHPAMPSEHDRKQAVPFFSYIIISVSRENILDTTSWRMGKTGQFVQEIIADTHLIEEILFNSKK